MACIYLILLLIMCSLIFFWVFQPFITQNRQAATEAGEDAIDMIMKVICVVSGYVLLLLVIAGTRHVWNVRSKRLHLIHEGIANTGVIL